MVEAVRAHGYRILIVDDGSPDGTGDLADQIAADDPGVSVLHRSEKQGLGRAYGEAFLSLGQSSLEVICQMDADLSHDPDDLPALVAAIDAGADVAIGSRYVPGGSTPDWPWIRRMISRGGNLYARGLLGLSTRDATAGYRAWAPTALGVVDPLTAQASGYGFQVEMVRRAESAGLTIAEVPITFRDRTAGQSKMGMSIVVEAMLLVTGWGMKRAIGKLPFTRP